MFDHHWLWRNASYGPPGELKSDQAPLGPYRLAISSQQPEVSVRILGFKCGLLIANLKSANLHDRYFASLITGLMRKYDAELWDVGQKIASKQVYLPLNLSRRQLSPPFWLRVAPSQSQPCQAIYQRFTTSVSNIRYLFRAIRQDTVHHVQEPHFQSSYSRSAYIPLPSSSQSATDNSLTRRAANKANT